jgi:hypothetical protein
MDAPPQRGEVDLLLKDIRGMSDAIMQDLLSLDRKLEELQDKAAEGYLDLPTAIDTIREIRVMIGSLEKEETQELQAEEITESLLKKLEDLIGKCL